MLRALGVEPRVFFSALYPEPGEPAMPGTILERFLDGIQRLGSSLPRPASPPPRTMDDGGDLDRRIREVVEEVLAEHRGKKKPR